MYRSSYILDDLGEELNLQGNKEKVILQNKLPDGGFIEVNTVDVKQNETWEGIYYTDYPISINAVAKEGYRFIAWSGDVDSSQECLELMIPQGGISLVAEFEKIEEGSR